MSCDPPYSAGVVRTNPPIAFEEMYKDNFDVLYSKAFSILRDESKAKDAVQELFLHIWEKKESLQIKISLLGYLLVSIHNNCIKMLTREERLKRKMEGYIFDLHLQQEQPELPGIHNNTTENNWMSTLYEARRRLSYNQELVIRKCYDEGKTYEQAAEEMNIKRNTVHSHIERSLAKFRSIFLNKNCGPSL
jgi:RNA polymerase sigma-70 factor (ECF subfamily)